MLISSLRRSLRHLREWNVCRREAQVQFTRRTWWKMLRGLIEGQVPVADFRRRARTCNHCVVYDRQLRRCAGPWLNGKPTGCGCYLPYLLRVKRPYPRGCWGRQFVSLNFGWK